MVIAVVGDEVMTLPATGKLFIELFILPGISIYTAGEVEGGSTRFANFYISAPDFFKWKKWLWQKGQTLSKFIYVENGKRYT